MYVLVCEVQGKHRIIINASEKSKSATLQKLKLLFSKLHIHTSKHIQIKNVPQFRYTYKIFSEKKKKIKTHNFNLKSKF